MDGATDEHTSKPAPRRTGPRSLRDLDPGIVGGVLSAIELGAPMLEAIGYGGIGVTTWYSWLRADPDLDERTRQARARALMARLVKIREAESSDWRAAAWWIEKRYPEEFGRSTIR